MEPDLENTVDLVVDGMFLLKYPKQTITVKILRSFSKAILVPGTTLCLSAAMYADPSIVAPCDNARLQNQMLGFATSANSVTPDMGIYKTYKGSSGS